MKTYHDEILVLNHDLTDQRPPEVLVARHNAISSDVHLPLSRHEIICCLWHAGTNFKTAIAVSHEAEDALVAAVESPEHTVFVVQKLGAESLHLFRTAWAFYKNHDIGIHITNEPRKP